MIKRLCVLYPDGSISIQSPQEGEAAAVNRARRECRGYNKGERDDRKHAAFGEIQIDLQSFKMLR
jgi:hypothetical protein